MQSRYSHLAWMCALLVVQGAFGAEPIIDVNTNAPVELNTLDLEARLRSHFAKVKNRKAEDLARESVLAAEFVDLQWQMQDMLNNDRSLQGLEHLGVKVRADGAVELDARTFPQWIPFHDSLKTLEEQTVFDTFAALLRQRGFRDSDLAALKEYLEANPTERLAFQATKPQVDSYAGMLRANTGRKPTLAQAKAYHYRLQRTYSEVLRKWAEGALNALEPQPQRILVSTLQEFSPVRVVYPDRNLDAILKDEMVHMQSPRFAEERKRMEREMQE